MTDGQKAPEEFLKKLKGISYFDVLKDYWLEKWKQYMCQKIHNCLSTNPNNRGCDFCIYDYNSELIDER